MLFPSLEGVGEAGSFDRGVGATSYIAGVGPVPAAGVGGTAPITETEFREVMRGAGGSTTASAGAGAAPLSLAFAAGSPTTGVGAVAAGAVGESGTGGNSSLLAPAASDTSGRMEPVRGLELADASAGLLPSVAAVLVVPAPTVGSADITIGSL